MPVTIVDHSIKIKNRYDANKKKALTAIGQAAVGVTVDYLESRYGKPIRITGDLMRSITSMPGWPDGDSVAIGSNMEYATWVHDGTARMTGRPYLRDAIIENTDVWREVAAENLADGLE